MATQSATQNTVKLVTRPPIVVVLGHVDHGKSSLLEAIREEFKITSKESGGITQHIGAYVAEYQGKSITFLDTPGHEAFSAMRSRGAKSADLAVLVVAADEGVKLQTKEAIEQIKKAELPMVVAINKIDMPEIKESAQYNVYVESFGGKVPFAEVSALQKQGIPELLEIILLVAELEDLSVDPAKPAEGIIIESFLDAKRGPTATLLVRDGTLQKGDIIGSKTALGKARILEDFQGNSIESASPATPAMVIGFDVAPELGEKFQVFQTEEQAKANLSQEPKKGRVSQALASDPGSATLDIVLKTDVLGSLEALEHMLLSLPQEKVVLRFVQSGIGEIGESDVKIAQSTNAIVLGFRTKASPAVTVLADREGVPIETFEVVYELVQRVRVLMEKSLDPEMVRKDIGTLRVLQVFLTDKNRQIIGGKVAQGEVRKGTSIEIVRNEEVVGKGKLVNLQKAKQDATVVSKGEECGMLFEGTERIVQGDTLQFFTQESQKRTL